MKAFTGLLAFVLLGTILGEDISEEQTQSTEDSSNGGCANFAGELYNRVQETLQEREDFVISPVGVSSLLGTLLFAVGQTSAREIANFLYPKCESSSEVAVSRPILQRQGSKLTMVTVAMVRRGVAVDKRFEDQAEKLGSLVYRTSFWPNYRDLEKIVYNKTNDHHFMDGLLYHTPDMTTRLFFYNRLRYRAKLAQKFSVVKGKQLFAPRVQALHAHVPELKARVLGLPLLNTTSFLLILLPDQENNLKSVELGLRRVDLRKLPSKLNSTTMDITLDIHDKHSYIPMRDALKKAGITTVFNETTADLSAFNREVPLDNALVVAEIDVNPSSYIHPRLQEESGAYPEFKALAPLIYAFVDSERVYVMGRQLEELKS